MPASAPDVAAVRTQLGREPMAEFDVVSEDVTTRGDSKDFTSRPRWQRFVVYLAGPAMNGVLTVSVLTALYMIVALVVARVRPGDATDPVDRPELSLAIKSSRGTACRVWCRDLL